MTNQLEIDISAKQPILPSNGHADDAQGRSARAKFVQMFAEL